MVERNCTLPFCVYCLTDNVYDLPKEVIGIQLDPQLDLESYWWKICLFNLDWEDPVLYFDLDIVIQNNFNYLFEKIDDQILVSHVEDAGCKCLTDGVYHKEEPLVIPRAIVNSSIIGLIPKYHKDVYEVFMKDVDNNIIFYYGLDRFLSSNFLHKLGHLDFSKDYYFRSKGAEYYDPQYVDSSGLFVVDPTKTFCIVSQADEDSYKGLEKYFL